MLNNLLLTKILFSKISEFSDFTIDTSFDCILVSIIDCFSF